MSTLRGSNTLLALRSVELPFGSSQNPARHAETIRLNPVVSSSIVRRTEVFEYFTRPEQIVLWMGYYAVLDPKPGGEFTLDINGVPVRGRSKSSLPTGS